MEEGDVNLPSAEAIFRQVLYGNNYFRKEFGKASAEYMLPGLLRLSGFAAQYPGACRRQRLLDAEATCELAARSEVGGPDSPRDAEGIPFNVGLWVGPDGKTVIAALNPGGYGSNVYYRPQQDRPPPPTRARPLRRTRFGGPTSRLGQAHRLDGKVTGVFADYHYVGTGDIGGAHAGIDVQLLEAIVTQERRPCFRRAVARLRGVGAPMPAPPAASGPKVGDGPVTVIGLPPTRCSTISRPR